MILVYLRFSVVLLVTLGISGCSNTLFLLSPRAFSIMVHYVIYLFAMMIHFLFSVGEERANWSAVITRIYSVSVGEVSSSSWCL